MIIKSFEINKINFDQNKLVLFYGKNEGFKNEVIKLIDDELEKVYSIFENEVKQLNKKVKQSDIELINLD